ncbi:MAG: imidazole glycerol phosphate synthase subunit HisH [Alphaproteobacteria bacterium]
MEAVLVDYGSGNLHSAKKALERAGQEAGLALTVTQTDNPAAVRRADRVILPGVGAFADCRHGLETHDGLVDALEDAARSKPLLGICVGMQLMASRGLEHGHHEGFGWIPGDVAALAPAGEGPFKLPHMGWNALDLAPGGHPVLAGLPGPNPHAYFVHSYAFKAANEGDVLASCTYGGRFTAVIGRDNLVGTQFHPEKSQAVGLKLLANFLAWTP